MIFGVIACSGPGQSGSRFMVLEIILARLEQKMLLVTSSVSPTPRFSQEAMAVDCWRLFVGR